MCVLQPNVTRPLVRHPLRFGLLTLGGATLAVAVAIAGPAVLGSGQAEPTVPAAAKPVRSGLGLNLTAPADFNRERSLMNLAQGGTGWMSGMRGKGGWVAFDPARLDGAMTVTSLAPDEIGYLVLAPPEGVYGASSVRVRCTWQGKGKLAPGGAASGVSQSANRVDFDWAAANGPKAQGTWLALTVTDPTDPVRAIDCREKPAAATAVFSPAFLESLAGYKLVRFLDWQSANANAPVTWASRTTLATQYQGGTKGVAVEYMVALANQAGVDPWFTMPWNADDDYIRRFAEYVRDNLAPGRTAYVEMSNEVWNYGFRVTHQAQAEGLAEGLSANPGEAMLRRYAEKSTQMHKIWTDVFKANPARLVRVVSTQAVNSWGAETVLSFRDTAQYTDALATAPYFGWGLFDGSRAGWTNLDQIFAWLDADIDASIAKAVETKAIATRFGKRSIAYEGGQHVVNSGNIALLESIQRDPRMYGLYKKYLGSWQTQIGDTMTLFNSTSPISQYGAWGLREYAGQSLAATPKRRAALDYINAVY